MKRYILQLQRLKFPGTRTFSARCIMRSARSIRNGSSRMATLPSAMPYESRFEELLSLSLLFERAHAQYACQACRGKKHGLSQASFRD